MKCSVSPHATFQVVPTLYSLKLLTKRSREVKRSGDWVEFLDPDTNAFWYLQEVRLRTVRDHPEKPRAPLQSNQAQFAAFCYTSLRVKERLLALQGKRLIEILGSSVGGFYTLPNNPDFEKELVPTPRTDGALSDLTVYGSRSSSSLPAVVRRGCAASSTDDPAQETRAIRSCGFYGSHPEILTTAVRRLYKIGHK